MTTTADDVHSSTRDSSSTEGMTLQRGPGISLTENIGASARLDESYSCASTVRALHRIAEFFRGERHNETIGLRDEAIHLAGEHFTPSGLAVASGLPLALIEAVLRS